VEAEATSQGSVWKRREVRDFFKKNKGIFLILVTTQELLYLNKT
jgi:hypothetical protein